MPSRFLLDILLFRLNWLAPQSCCFHIQKLLASDAIRHLSLQFQRVPERQELPELDGKTPKMSPAEVASFPDAFSGVEVRIWRITILATPRYRGGKICLDIHFAPLWRSTVHVFLHVLAKLRQCHNDMQHRCRYVVSPCCRANVPKFGISHALSLAQFLAKEKRCASSIKFDLSDLILLILSLSKALGPWLAAEIPYLIETGVVTHKGSVA